MHPVPTVPVSIRGFIDHVSVSVQPGPYSSFPPIHARRVREKMFGGKVPKISDINRTTKLIETSRFTQTRTWDKPLISISLPDLPKGSFSNCIFAFYHGYTGFAVNFSSILILCKNIHFSASKQIRDDSRLVDVD